MKKLQLRNRSFLSPDVVGYYEKKLRLISEALFEITYRNRNLHKVRSFHFV